MGRVSLPEYAAYIALRAAAGSTFAAFHLEAKSCEAVLPSGSS